MDCQYSPWLFSVWAFYFAEDTILFHQDFIANLVIIINACAIFVGHIKIGSTLPKVSNLVPVGYGWDAEEHFAFKYCHVRREALQTVR
jgi:hypothetical protein